MNERLKEHKYAVKRCNINNGVAAVSRICGRVMKNPVLMKEFVSETVVNLWEIVYTGLRVPPINVVAK